MNVVHVYVCKMLQFSCDFPKKLLISCVCVERQVFILPWASIRSTVSMVKLKRMENHRNNCFKSSYKNHLTVSMDWSISNIAHRTLFFFHVEEQHRYGQSVDWIMLCINLNFDIDTNSIRNRCKNLSTHPRISFERFNWCALLLHRKHNVYR